MNGSHLLWVTDADNTLWDTNGIYARAQLALVDHVVHLLDRPLRTNDRLAWLRESDQAIASKHPQGLRYPPELLVLALAERLLADQGSEGVPPSDPLLHPRAVEALVEQYLAMLKETPGLLPGVRSGLAKLHARGCRVIVVTEGSVERIIATLQHHQIQSFIHDVIEARKTVALFEKIRLANKCSVSWAVGDQLDRDVFPAIGAGFRGIFIEGGFKPKWHPAIQVDSEYAVMQNYEEAVLFAESVSYV